MISTSKDPVELNPTRPSRPELAAELRGRSSGCSSSGWSCCGSGVCPGSFDESSGQFLIHDLVELTISHLLRFATAFSISLNLGAKHEDLVRNCELLEEELRKHECKPFFACDKLGFVDVVLAAPAIWALDLIPSEESCPNLHKLMAAIRDHPLVKSVLPEPEALKKILIQAAPVFSQFYGGKS